MGGSSICAPPLAPSDVGGDAFAPTLTLTFSFVAPSSVPPAREDRGGELPASSTLIHLCYLDLKLGVKINIYSWRLRHVNGKIRDLLKDTHVRDEKYKWKTHVQKTVIKKTVVNKWKHTYKTHGRKYTLQRRNTNGRVVQYKEKT